jgi:Trehalose utilisation
VRKIVALIVLWGLSFSVICKAQDILVVADEFQAMLNLTSHIQSDTQLSSKIVGQTEMPKTLAGYRAVIVYIHGDLQPQAEHAFIAYAQEGGKLILLHHSISSHKRENKDWFSFLHIELPPGDLAVGGYKYFAPVSFDIVDLAHGSYVTSHNVHFDKTVPYTDPAGGAERTLPGTSFDDTEVYLNHRLEGPRTLLLGIKYRDPASGVVYMQDTAGWLMQSGKGMVFYFMVGHRPEDFNNPAYSQILSNAVAYHN